MPQDQVFLEFVIKGLVDHPEDVKVTRIVDQMGVLLTLTVHKEDMGKIIGRDGATAKAVRTLLRVAGMKSEARVNLKINEPDGSPYVPTPRDDSGSDAQRTSYQPAAHQMTQTTQTTHAHVAAPLDKNDPEYIDPKEVPQNYQSAPSESPRMKSVDEILESL
jgi:uncharacterized protein